MDLLKEIMDIVEKAPELAIWVLAGILLYKVVIIGSIFGVVRLAIQSLHSWATQPEEEKVVKDFMLEIDHILISKKEDVVNTLKAQILRLRGKGLGIDSDYIHKQSVEWLREAIDEKIERDSL